MSTIPKNCPKCNSSLKWKKVDVSRKGFGIGKSLIGGYMLGPLGLIAGTIGKNKVLYHCGQCNYKNEYSKLGVSSQKVADTVKNIVD